MKKKPAFNITKPLLATKKQRQNKPTRNQGCATLGNVFYKNLTYNFIRTFAFIIFVTNIKKNLWRE